MPALSPQLIENIAQILLLKNLSNSNQRASWLYSVFGQPDVYKHIDTEGSPEVFAQTVIRQLSHEQLCAALRGLQLGVNHQISIEALCRQIEEQRLNPTVDGQPNALLWQYRHAAIKRWEQDPHKLDKQFVRLVVLQSNPQREQAQPQESIEYTDLRDLLANPSTHPALILLGVPGSGKSTLLRRLQLDHEQDRMADGGPTLSFYAALNRYPIEANNPRAWLAQLWHDENPDLPSFDSLLTNGRLLLLLDALNEMAHHDPANYDAKVRQWRDFVHVLSHHHNRAVFSCRRQDYSALLSSETTPVTQVSIKPMSMALIAQFLHANVAPHAAELVSAIEANPKLVELYSTPYFASLLAMLARSGDPVPHGRAGLFTRFVRAALHRELERQNSHLLDPAVLTDDDRKWIGNRDQWQADYKLPEMGLLMPRITALAYQMQQHGAEVSLALTETRNLLGNVTPKHADDLLQAALSLNILDQDLNKGEVGEVKFFHQLLQEYFAARALAKQPDPILVQQAWHKDQVRPSLAETLKNLPLDDPLPLLANSGWAESSKIAATLCNDPDAFVRNLMPVNLPLAGEAAAQPDIQLPVASKRKLQNALLSRMHDRDADLRARIAAGLALGQLGDPRLTEHHGPYGRYLLPPLVTIPAGRYEIGEENDPNSNEKPHTVNIAAFEMATLPVSNAEYDCFMAAKGYENERWWPSEAAKRWHSGESVGKGTHQQLREMRAQLQAISEAQIRALTLTPTQVDAYLHIRTMPEAEFEAFLADEIPTGRALRQPSEWGNPNFKNPAQPLVGVCWYEASAYCAWLSAQTGRHFRLPSEAKWEVAARRARASDNGWGRLGKVLRPFRRYAYPGKFDPLRANTFESHIRGTTPVGLYIEGCTPDNIFDLTGNVWEWTSSIYADYPYIKEDGREDPEDENKPRTVRGGAWYILSNSARAAYRFRDLATNRSYISGFRLVV